MPEHTVGFLIIAALGLMLVAEGVLRLRHPADWWRRGVWRHFPGWLWANPHYLLRHLRRGRSARAERVDALVSLLVGVAVVAVGLGVVAQHL